jgi:TonB family protein
MNPESFTEEFRQLLDWEKVTARSGRITTQGGMGNGTVYASVQEVARHTSAIADANNGEVLKAKEVVVDGKPQYEGEKVYDTVEQMPEFPGGPVALMKWLNENIKYPSIAEENGIQGRVVCSFIVETDGSFSNLEVVRSIDPSLDKEAVRVLKKMPKWNPGKQNGSSVRVKYIVPVTFMLQPAVKKSPQRVTR